MKERAEYILFALVEEHVKTGEPVGSKFLAEKKGVQVSSATVRNILTELEEEGLVAQPHTSAGRIPTGKGYRYYLQHFLDKEKLTKNERSVLTETLNQESATPKQRVKQLAKTIADLSQETVFVGFTPEEVYYTGLAHLFSKPEFTDTDRIFALSTMMDHLDDLMDELFVHASTSPQVFIGSENPLSHDCGLVVTRYQLAEVYPGVIGIIGPKRMDYRKNIALLNVLQTALVIE